VELERQLESMGRRGLGVAALSYDSVPILKEFAERRHISYPLLSDPDSAAIRAFGLLNPEYPEGHMAHGVPFPGTFVTDAMGIIRAKYFEKSYAERRTGASVLVESGETPKGASELRTDQFVLRLSSSNDVVAAGNRVTLVLDFEMVEGRHAYAPGAKGYRPVALHLDPQPLLNVHEASFPTPKSYTFKPLGETVPVFEGHFRVLQDITLGSPSQLGELLKSPEPELSITGKLDYQVCSDRLCYPPASLPLRWTLKVVPLDRERSPEALRHRPPQPASR